MTNQPAHEYPHPIGDDIQPSPQQAFIDRILSHTLRYPHVLYCMNNETGEPVAWSEYWIEHIRKRADEAGRTVHTTDMRRNNDLTAEDHMHIYLDPDRYSFVDISQNNSDTIGLGEIHWERVIQCRTLLGKHGPRPMNNTKIYSREEGVHVQAGRRFWRNVFGGCASVRFHRPHPLEGLGGVAEHDQKSFHGLGLHPEAQAHIRSMRMLADAIDIVACTPSPGLLTDRDPDEAYCLADAGRVYAIYFPDDSSVSLDLSAAPARRFTIEWLAIPESTWTQVTSVTGGGTIHLESTGGGPRAVLLRPG